MLAGAGPLEGSLRRVATREPVHLLGLVPQALIPGLLAAADLVAVPSRTTATWKEQFGRSALEAMACARPTLVSDSGSLPHVAGDGARVLPEAAPAAWAEAIDELLADPEARRLLGERGRRRALECYTWEAVALAHERAWREARVWRDSQGARSLAPPGYSADTPSEGPP